MEKELAVLLLAVLLLHGCTNGPKACTAEAKMCQDGSYVGRGGPNCEFAPCPQANSTACSKDAKKCPDGTVVGRLAPDCEFAPCPYADAEGFAQAAARSCRFDSDCVLVNSENWFSCCWSGACEPIDLMQPKWIAVNRQWFEEGRRMLCPGASECGPAPGCPTQVINDYYEALCMEYACVKASTMK